jgi:membrane associated rhomboid family serine protease
MDDPAGDGQKQGPPEPEVPPDRTSGLTLDTCYRHPKVFTGVHCTRCGRPICPDCMRPAPVGYQCPNCVADARKVGPRRRVKIVLGRPGRVTTILLAVNIGMFVLELGLGAAGGLYTGGSPQKLAQLGAMVPCAVAEQHQYWRLFTVMFLHASLLHIFFNMYALYLFGYLIENALGSARFIALYFLTGFLASATSFVFSNPNVAAVGASGAIFGLLGAWVAYNYRRRGSALASANLRWAYMIIGINLFLGFSIASIDNFAHIGGLIAGAAAGYFAEGAGPRDVRKFVQVGGLAALALVGVVMVAARIAAFPSARCFG